jgi:hypothetical protein
MSEMRVSRRKFLTGSAAAAAGAAVATSGVTLLSERAEAFFNVGAFWKKPAGSGQTSNGYTIGQSLRFNSTSSAYLNWPISTTYIGKSNFSFWVKRGKFGTQQGIWSAYATGAYNWYAGLRFETDDTLYYYDYRNDSGVFNAVKTTMVFRDPSAWYHILITADDGGTSPLKIYVNGVLQSLTATVNPAYFFGLNTYGATITSGQYQIGHDQYVNAFLDGYLADVYLVSGTILNPTDFGQTDTNSAQWIPKAYSAGSYSINGFYLKFADNSNTTAATLGKDSSGQGNNWTPSGFQTYDQVLDSPIYNFCNWNPLSTKGGAGVSLSSASLSATCNSNGSISPQVYGTLLPSSGKWYFEITPASSNDSGNMYIGVGATDFDSASVTYRAATGNKRINGAESAYFASGFGVSDVVQVAYDASSGFVYFGVNGSWRNNPDFSNGTNAVAGVPAGYGPLATHNTGAAGYNTTFVGNFGQGGQSGLTYDAASGGRFKYTPPAGFKALCSVNLAAPTIKNSSQYFNVALYAGNGTGQSISSLAFQPDLVWFKVRNYADDGGINDSVRGANFMLAPSTTGTEVSSSAYVTSFNSNGMTIGSGNYLNRSGYNFVAWCWKAGGTAVSNTAGTITSTVSANSTAGFSIVTFSGGGSAGTVGHGLGTTPAMCIFKSRNNIGTTGWNTWHQNLTGSNYYLDLSSTAQQSNGASNFSGTWTSTTFGLTATPLASGANLVAYLWAEVAGFSRFGSYTGNGSADGSFVYCGFKPRFILFKSTNYSGSWQVWDSARNPINIGGNFLTLFPNLTSADTSSEIIDVVSNGFKMRTSNMNLNYSGYNYIFAAFAEAPFKYATAR